MGLVRTLLGGEGLNRASDSSLRSDLGCKATWSLGSYEGSLFDFSRAASIVASDSERVDLARKLILDQNMIQLATCDDIAHRYTGIRVYTIVALWRTL